MEQSLVFSRLHPRLELQRRELMSFVVDGACRLELTHGSVWLTEDGQDIVLHAPAVRLLHPGLLIVLEALSDQAGLYLQSHCAMTSLAAHRAVAGARLCRVQDRRLECT